jgi:hypothetical protein
MAGAEEGLVEKIPSALQDLLPKGATEIDAPDGVWIVDLRSARTVWKGR